jgi:acyl transferase domain-containing protein
MSDSPYRERLERSLGAIRGLKRRIAALEASRDPIAVVGAALRVPGASDLEGFRALVFSSSDPLGPVPSDRWGPGWFDPSRARPGTMYTDQGGFLEDVRSFDAAFFGIAPREAAVLDPAHRLCLELCWEALEHAGCAPDRVPDTGVFLGLSSADYRRLLSRRPASEIDAWVGTGNVASAAAGRVAYQLGLTGPCLSVDTACSSSLVAVHLAAQSLSEGACSLALAGGVQLLLDPEGSVYFCALGALSPTGRCRSFSADADGYTRSEGGGVVVLERLSDAVRNRRRVLGLLHGSAVGHDGRSNGFTAPNPAGQARVMSRALQRAGVRPDQVGMVETHGTGTVLGDPVEVEALTQVYGHVQGPVYLGAGKSQLGHLEAAAGVVGLLRALVALQAGAVPANLHLTTPNPHIDWASLPFRLPTAVTSWSHPERYAAVSSFGFAGTNASVVVQAPPAPAQPEAGVSVLALSAASPERLRLTALAWRAALLERPGCWVDLAYTALVARSLGEQRLAVVAVDGRAAVEGLDAWLDGGPAVQCELAEREQQARGFVRTGELTLDAGRVTTAPCTPWVREVHWAADAPAPPEAPAADRPEVAAGPVDLQCVVELVARVLGMPPANVGPHRSIPELGLDSVMALELRNLLQQATGQALSATVVWDHPTPVALLEVVQGGDALTRMSEADAAALLEAELDALE